MTEAANVLEPRHLAVALILERVQDVADDIDRDIRWRHADDLFNSRIEVFKRQLMLELRRAALHLQRVEWADDPHHPGEP